MKRITKLKAWPIVKVLRYNIENLRESGPENYLFQLNNGTWYPVIRISDVPPDFSTVDCFKHDNTQTKC